MVWGDGSNFICFNSSFSGLRSGNKKLSPFPSEISSMQSLFWSISWSIFCILTLLCWQSSVNHSRSCNLANCWRQSKKRGKWVPLSSGWASSEMLTSSEMIARAANCAKYDFTKGMSTSSLGHWSNTFRKACMKLSLVAIPFCLSKLIKELAFSLSLSLLSSDRMITLLNISGRKCLGALNSLTPLTASFAFPLFRYSVTTVSVSLSSSSFDGGGFLLVLAGFSWISGGLVLRPSWGVCPRGGVWVRGGCALGGIIVIWGWSFGTWFLFIRKDWAGLKLISSALSCPFLENRGGIPFDCPCSWDKSPWLWLW